LQNTAILKQILLQVFAFFALYTNIVRMANRSKNLINVRAKTNILQNTAILKQILLQVFAFFCIVHQHRAHGQQV